MKNLPHPGRIVRQECIEPLGLTVTEAAKRLGVKRQTLNNLGGVSAEMAVRLSKAFGSSPEVWLGLQMEYDLAQVQTGRRLNQSRQPKLFIAFGRLECNL
jgi:addiction module HigA family antidote